MPVPDFQSFFLPLLQGVADGAEHSVAQLRAGIAETLQLTAEDLAQRLPSGVQTVFANRIAWSTVYLAKAGAIERVKRGVFRITSRGREFLGLGLPKLTIQHLSRFPEFVSFHKGEAGSTIEPSAKSGPQTPEEQLASSYKVLRNSLASEVLDAVKSAPADFFEELVVRLLVKMGYGGSVEDAGKAVGRGGDGGIDGIIKEDKLGLDVVYVQAKRWSNSVGRPFVQAFAGSLEGVRARKGVMITTSYFTQDALDYVQKIEKRIVLIDGRQLADLMIDYDLGVTLVQSYPVKRLDADFFESA